MSKIIWDQQSKDIYVAKIDNYVLQVVYTPNTKNWFWQITQGKEIIEDGTIYKPCNTAEHAIEQCETAFRVEMIFLEQAPKPPTGGAMVFFTSHRARDRALRVIGDPKPQAYASFRRDTGHGVYLLDSIQLEAIRGLGGWRKLRGPYSDLMECINHD